MAVQSRRIAPSASIPRFNPSLTYRLLIIIIAWALGAAASFAYLGGALPIVPRDPQAAGGLFVPVPPDCRDGTCECGDGICTPHAGEDNNTCPADCRGASVCGNSACEPGENGVSGDPGYCIDCDPSAGGDTCNENGICGNWEDATCIDCQGWPASCGDDVCNNGESSSTCPVDCMVCGNNTCEPLFGESSSTCPADCGLPLCGNNVCESPENAQSCPVDCGITCDHDATCDSNETDACSDCWDDSMCSGGAPDGVCFNEKVSSCVSDCGKTTLCGNQTCDAGETVSSCPADCTTTAPTEEPKTDPTRTSATTYCGDNVCNGSEDIGWCPVDCTPDPVCGDDVCNGTETKTSCAADCAEPAVCGDDVCDANQGETRTTCSADCGVVTVSPTRTPLPTLTTAPEETDEPSETDEPALVEVAEVTTDEPPPTEPPPAPEPEPTATGENADLTENQLEFVETFTLNYLPTGCKLMSLEDAGNAVSNGLDEFSGELALFADRVLVCEGAPDKVCVPAASEAGNASEVQIISCNESGECRVYQATELGAVEGESIACVETRFGRPMPRCGGACASGTGIKVTEADISGYVIPFGILLTVAMIGGVGFTFMFSRTRNRDLDEEIDGMDDEGIVTKP